MKQKCLVQNLNCFNYLSTPISFQLCDSARNVSNEKMLEVCASLAAPPDPLNTPDDKEQPNEPSEAAAEEAPKESSKAADEEPPQQGPAEETLTGDASPGEVVIYILETLKTAEDLGPLLTLAREHPLFKSFEDDKYASEGLTKDEWEFGGADSDPQVDLEDFCMFCTGPMTTLSKFKSNSNDSAPAADPVPCVGHQAESVNVEQQPQPDEIKPDEKNDVEQDGAVRVDVPAPDLANVGGSGCEPVPTSSGDTILAIEDGRVDSTPKSPEPNTKKPFQQSVQESRRKKRDSDSDDATAKLDENQKGDGDIDKPEKKEKKHKDNKQDKKDKKDKKEKKDKEDHGGKKAKNCQTEKVPKSGKTAATKAAAAKTKSKATPKATPKRISKKGRQTTSDAQPAEASKSRKVGWAIQVRSCLKICHQLSLFENNHPWSMVLFFGYHAVNVLVVFLLVNFD